jgi:hypothetical protein
VATPEEEERVRRLLASAGPVPMPEHVHDRLQRVVAELAAERDSGEAPAATAAGTAAEGTEHVESGNRQAPRWPRLLVAAAVVAVLGIGVGVGVAAQLGGSGNGNSETSAGSASSAQGSRAGGAHSQQRSEGQGAVPSQTLSAREARAQSMLHRDSLRADVRRVAHFAPQLNAVQGSRAPRGCATPATRPGDQLFPVRLDGRKATLLLQAPKGGTRVARVYSCDDARTPTARTAVPAR